MTEKTKKELLKEIASLKDRLRMSTRDIGNLADETADLRKEISALKDDLRKALGSNKFLAVTLRGLHNKYIRKAVHGKDEMDHLQYLHDEYTHHTKETKDEQRNLR